MQSLFVTFEPHSYIQSKRVGGLVVLYENITIMYKIVFACVTYLWFCFQIYV